MEVDLTYADDSILSASRSSGGRHILVDIM